MNTTCLNFKFSVELLSIDNLFVGFDDILLSCSAVGIVVGNLGGH